MPGYNIGDIGEVLFESTFMALVIVDKDGYITLMNQAFLDLLGLSRDQAVGRYVLDVLPHSELPEVLKTGRIDKADIWPIDGNDTVVSRFPIIKNGEIVGAIGQSFFLDMSGARILMQKLQETEEEFRAYCDALIESPYMVYVSVNRQGFVTLMNQTYLNELGLERKDAIGKYILDVIPASQLPEILKTGRVDKADIWPINERDTIVTRLPIMKNGEIIGAVGKSLFLDVSGVKIMMQKLKETEKEFQALSEALIESPYMLYVIVDKDGIITAMNRTFLNTLEMQKEEVVGKHILDILPNSELPEILKTGRVDEAVIWSIKGRDTIMSRMPVMEDGKIIGAIAKSLFLDMSGARIFMQKLQETEKELNIYREEIRQGYQAQWEFDDLIGASPNFLKLKSVAEQLSHTISTVLITGESGTGKELFAHAIHNCSNRRNYPFVKINCAALPENLLESELFGYEEGAFTGARKGGKHGKFELAMGGTIFLDEIGDMPLTMQTKLLTVLQDRVVERVGGTKPIFINVRVIAATNRNLEQMVSEQKFRQDLYYRLNVVTLNIPPLRERSQDIPLLVDALIKKINSKLDTNIKKVSSKAIELMQNYFWPGNVRELENLLERAINLADMNREDSISVKHFPHLVENTYFQNNQSPTPATLSESVQRLEKQLIIQALKKTNGNKVQAAKMLGIYTSALYRKLTKYSLE